MTLARSLSRLTDIRDGVAAMADFVAAAVVPADARERAAVAFKDTIGVMLAGAGEPAARIAQSLAADEGAGECRVLGTQFTAGPGLAALANGVAAHALDYDDMCFVSLAHRAASSSRRCWPPAS
jgi:2-methylcitrate dehydratase PrpD